MQTFTQAIRFGFLVTACLAISACETMGEFYEEVVVASVNEVIVEPARNAEISHCYGCDWIVQEFHRGEWETRNSDPYDTQEECLVAKHEQEDRHTETIFRCIHESELD